jgi:Kef-type K+ transport system membrane component KefB/nucleotide-binding universal stress UspA family protein
MEFISQVLALEPTTTVLGKEQIIPFAILLVVILVVPIIFERLRLPGMVGLLIAGVVLGPHGWNLINANSAMMKLLSEIGLVYLMFVAGLEIDINQFRNTTNRSLGFGSFAFGIPLAIGIFVGRISGFDWNASIFIGSLFASQTLLAYPIINRLGVVNNEAVTVTIGATVFTDISALLLLAVCIAVHTGQLNPSNLIILLGWLTIYTTVVLVGFDRAGKEFLRRSGEDEGNQFLFVLLAVFLAAIGAQLIGIEKIVGAFLAGLVVNETLGEGPVKEKVIFVGNSLFIPIFFMNLGLLVNLAVLTRNINAVQLTLFIIAGLIVSKFIAALLAKLIYRYNWQEAVTIWSLSIPQVGVTLAATLVGYRTGVLSETLLTSIIILMLVTSTLGPLITSRVAVGLSLNSSLAKFKPGVQQPIYPSMSSGSLMPSGLSSAYREKIVVPIHNPHTQQYLIEMAALLAKQSNGKIIPLAIATATAHMDAPQLESSLRRSERLLAKANARSQTLSVDSDPLLRIDDAFAQGISRAAKEQKASLIIMGWGKRTGLRAKLFGNVTDSVLWSSHCPVAVSRLVESPSKIQRILVPIENLISPTLQPIHFAQILAEANQAQVTVLNVCERRTSSSKIAARRSQLAFLISKLAPSNPPEIQIITHKNFAQAILQAARLYDLVVLPFIRNSTVPGGLAISDVTTQLAGQLSCSIVMLGEPQRRQPAAIPVGIASTTAII